MEINSIQIATPTNNSTIVGSLENGNTAAFTVASIREGVSKKYVGLVAQESTFAPELTTIFSTLESPVVTSRDSEGVYIVSSDDFLNNKTFWSVTPTPTTSMAASFVTVRHLNDNQRIEIRTFSEDGTLSDEVLNNASILIEVYP